MNNGTGKHLAIKIMMAFIFAQIIIIPYIINRTFGYLVFIVVLVVLLLIEAAIGLLKLRPSAIKNKRIKSGRCPICKYYLIDGVEKGCPECGWSRRGNVEKQDQ